jgi:hypothetical protein
LRESGDRDDATTRDCLPLMARKLLRSRRPAANAALAAVKPF